LLHDKEPFLVYVSEIMSHFGLQMDSDFQNMIFKNVDRSERSVNVNVSSQQVNTVRADIVEKVHSHLFVETSPVFKLYGLQFQ
jgi:hypothetical protein